MKELVIWTTTTKEDIMIFDNQTGLFLRHCDDIVELVLEKLEQRIRKNYKQIGYVVNQTQQIGDLQPLVEEWSKLTAQKNMVINLYDVILFHVGDSKMFSDEDVRMLVSIINAFPDAGAGEVDGLEFVPKNPRFAKTLEEASQLENE